MSERDVPMVAFEHRNALREASTPTNVEGGERGTHGCRYSGRETHSARSSARAGRARRERALRARGRRGRCAQ
eukprot:1691742-Pleurochrysis_carterae.AAC.1